MAVIAHAHTLNVADVSITERINQIGEATFTIPAAEATLIGATFGRRYQLYNEYYGYLGIFTQSDMTIDADGKRATIKAYDSLIEMANVVVGYGRNYNDVTIANVLNQLDYALPGETAGLISSTQLLGWLALFESGFDSTQKVTLSFQGETLLRAMDVLRQYFRGFFRRESDTTITFGSFTATTPVFRLYGPVLAYADASNGDTFDFATITALKREQTGSSVVNRIFAFGSGIGETQIDLSYSTRTTPYVITPVNFIYDEVTVSGAVWCVEDAVSIAAYGAVEKTMTVTEIRPITNSEADLINASNALYDMAVAELLKYKDPQEIYSVSCINLPLTVKAGSLIRVDYAGVAELETGNVAYITLANRKFFVTQITRRFGESGNPIADLTISASGQEIVGITDVMSGLISDVGGLKLHVQPSMTYYTKSSPTLPIDPTRFVDFTFYIGSEVLAINEMKVEFTLMPLRVYATTTEAEADTVSSGSSGPSDETSSGPSSISSSVDGGSLHTHGIHIAGSGGGNPIYVDSGVNFNFAGAHGAADTATGQGNIDHSHNIEHDHNIEHTHTLDVEIPAHSHALTFGISDDSQTPQTVTVTVNGTGVSDIVDTSTSTIVGASVSGAGTYLVDIIDVMTASDFRMRTHTVRFECGTQRGQLYAQLLSRVTIQPIASGPIAP